VNVAVVKAVAVYCKINYDNILNLLSVQYLKKVMLHCIGLGSSYFRVGSRGCPQNSEFPTWKFDISNFIGTIFPIGKIRVSKANGMQH